MSKSPKSIEHGDTPYWEYFVIHVVGEGQYFKVNGFKTKGDAVKFIESLTSHSWWLAKTVKMEEW